MQVTVSFEAFDRRDGFADGVGERRQARAASHAIDDHRAGAALAFTATVLRSGQADFVAQDKKKRYVWLADDRILFAIYRDCLGGGFRRGAPTCCGQVRASAVCIDGCHYARSIPIAWLDAFSLHPRPRPGVKSTIGPHDDSPNKGAFVR